MQAKERIIALYEKIYQKESIYLQALALDFEVSLRTLQRDFALFKNLPFKKVAPFCYELEYFVGGG